MKAHAVVFDGTSYFVTENEATLDLLFEIDSTTDDIDEAQERADKLNIQVSFNGLY